MGHRQLNIGQSTEVRQSPIKENDARLYDFVLEKSIFNKIFEKDIRKVFLYKKAERLAKALYLIAPAFVESVSLRERIDAIAVGLVDAAILPSSAARTTLARELLTLSSLLSIAHTSGLLSPMNADLIAHEVHMLLKEVAAYEEPRLSFGEAPTLSDIAKQSLKKEIQEERGSVVAKRAVQPPTRSGETHKGHIKDSGNIKDRRDAILSVIRNKKKASIKDISTLIRNVSEKTIQRELSVLIETGEVLKQGERRWSTYTLI